MGHGLKEIWYARLVLGPKERIVIGLTSHWVQRMQGGKLKRKNNKCKNGLMKKGKNVELGPWDRTKCMDWKDGPPPFFSIHRPASPNLTYQTSSPSHSSPFPSPIVQLPPRLPAASAAVAAGSSRYVCCVPCAADKHSHFLPPVHVAHSSPRFTRGSPA